MKMLIKFLTRFLQPYSVKIINQLLRDNDRLDAQWREKYAAMEKEKWYWYDRYMDEVIYEPDKKS